MKELAVVLSLALSMMTAAEAAELKLIAGGSLAGLFGELGPQFEKATGHRLAIHFDSTPNIIARVNSGTPFDAVVVPIDVFKDATAKDHCVPGSIIDIARVGYGVIVRAGAAKPDISTSEAFRKALLDAKSIASVPASAAGASIAKVYERLGIGEEMKAKTRVQQAPTAIAPAVANGEAELGIFLTSVFISPGVELVGPFPADLQQELAFTAAIAADAKETGAAKALIDYLKTPAAIAMIKAAGMTPG
jgi:molybdate transport system substrate-binding protein